jgi:CBS domain containing-hemolysin-like protein
MSSEDQKPVAESGADDSKSEPSLVRTIGNLLRAVGLGRDEDTDWREALRVVITKEDDIAEHIGPEERRLLMNLLRFAGLAVSEAMVPRRDIAAIEENATQNEVIAAIKAHGHTRMPVYRGTLDEVFGMIHMRDIIAGLNDPKPFRLADIAHKVLAVPRSMPASELLIKMRETRTHMAIVIDEYGGTDGLVTIEDLVELIVGEIEDEHDAPAAPALIAASDGAIEVDARLSLEVLEERLGRSLRDQIEDEDIETVGGLVSALLGRMPRRGERIAHPAGFVFEVLDADPRRVKRLKVREQARTPPGGA